MKVPEIDLGGCTLCGGCMAVCPEVFRLNDAGFVEVVELSEYPKDCVGEAIKYCPEDCIFWTEE